LLAAATGEETSLADRFGEFDDGTMAFTSRVATAEDENQLREVMDAAIEELQRGFLSEDQIESSRAIMGIDHQLIADGTYYVIEHQGVIAGCGGWSRRATLYGSDTTPGRDPRLLDPAVDAARVRAMYTAPAFARRGVGWLILELCERAAAAEGFTRLELMGTMSGQPLYTKYGFVPHQHVEDNRGGAAVPLVKMEKTVNPALLRP
jgi:GNAT superfamily N-acetyltransferase